MILWTQFVLRKLNKCGNGTAWPKLHLRVHCGGACGNFRMGDDPGVDLPQGRYGGVMYMVLLATISDEPQRICGVRRAVLPRVPGNAFASGSPTPRRLLRHDGRGRSLSACARLAGTAPQDDTDRDVRPGEGRADAGSGQEDGMGVSPK